MAFAMLNSFFDWLQDHQPLGWIFLAVFLGFNVWFDFHNPGYALVDGIIVFICVVTYFFFRS